MTAPDGRRGQSPDLVAGTARTRVEAKKKTHAAAEAAPLDFAGRDVQLIAAAGCRIVTRPSYSPDFNPLENCISKLKQFLRQAKART